MPSDSSTTLTSGLTNPPPREAPASPPPLPPSLAQHLAGHGWARNLVGEAGAAVYRVHRPGEPDAYLKHARGAAAGELTHELLRLRWLGETGLPVPALLHFECGADEAWLLTRALPGRTAYDWLLHEPERGPQIVAALAALLRRLHALPVAPCPFNAHHTLRLAHAHRRLVAGLIDAEDFDESRQGWTPEAVWQAMERLLPLSPDPVVSHGDFSLDNVLLDAAGSVTGVIDLGRLGVADRYQDLAILWNCLGEFGDGLQQRMFEAYGLEQPDEGKLEFHLCLDECF